MALAGIALLAAASWLLLPRPRSELTPAAPLLVAALDASASVTRQRPAWSAWARAELGRLAERARGRGEELALVEFARDVALAFGPGDPAAFDADLAGAAGEPYLPGARVRADDLASELAGALELAADLARGRPAAEVVVLGDRAPGAVDPRPALARLAAEGVPTRWSEPPPPVRGDLALRELRVAPLVEAGAPWAVAVALAYRPGVADGGAERSLVVRVDGPGGPFERRVALAGGGELAPGADGWRRWSQRLELPPRAPGLHRIEARVQLVRGGVDVDPAPENDAARAVVRVRGALLVARVASPAARQALAGFRPAGIEWLDVELADVAPALARADALWTLDVPFALLPADAVEAFVRGGGGWFACAGWGALPGWNLGAHPADLLPLLPDEGDLPERDVVLLVDGSGSMAGEPFERVREATLALVLAGRPRDRFQLHFFTGTLGPVVFEAGGADLDERRRALEPLLAARVPRGPTDVLFALQQLAQRRADAERPGLAFLITDGLTEGWTGELSRAARQRLASTGTDLRVLAVGPRADRAFLTSLLLEGEALVEAGDLSDLDELLQREANADRTRDAGGRSALAVDATTLAPGSVARELVDGWAADLEGLGVLRRYVAATLAPGSELLWSAPDGAPLLAIARVGSGTVAACATAPVPGWGELLRARPALVEPLVRALARGRSGERAAPRARLVGDELRLEDVPADWPARVEARVSEGRDPSFAGPRRGRLVARAVLDVPSGGADPSAPRRRVGRRPPGLSEEPGPGRLQVDVEAGGAALASLALEAGAPAELDAAPRRPLEPPEAAARAPAGPPRGSAAHRAAPALLALGLVASALAALMRGVHDQGSGGSGRR